MNLFVLLFMAFVAAASVTVGVVLETRDSRRRRAFARHVDSALETVA